MKETDYKKYLKFINEYKKVVGLSDWTVKLDRKDSESEDNLAEVESNAYEKELVITLTKGFHKLSSSRKKNVLLHELIHGRVEIFNKRKEVLVEEIEEELVNDLVRGFERHKTLKW